MSKYLNHQEYLSDPLSENPEEHDQKPLVKSSGNQSLLRRIILLAWASLAVLFLSGLSASACYAQVASFTDTDVGYTGATGSYTFTSGSPPTYTVAGAGAGIGGTTDSLTFASVQTAGNAEIEAQVDSMTSGTSGAFAGLMMRDSFNTDGAMAAIGVTPSSGLNFSYRTHGGYYTVVSGPALTAPVYLRLVRSGNSISGYYGSDGINWTLLGTDTPGSGDVMPNLYNVGFAVYSTTYGTLNTAVFNYVVCMASVPQQSSNLLLWLRSDVGVTYSGGTVSAWADQSGNGNNASQGTGALQPALSTGAINDAVLPAITFDGSSQYLSMASDFANLSGGASLFLVLDPTSSMGAGDPCAFGNASNSDAVFPQTVGQNASLYAYNGATSSSVTTSGSPLSIGSYQLLEITLLPGSGAGTATGTIYLDGVQQVQSTSLQNPANTTRADNYIGTGIGLTDYFQGGIAEVLLFNAPVTDSQRACVEAYVLSKFSVGNQPTLDAPTFSLQSGAILAPEQTLSMSQDQLGTVWFTQDGSTPVPNSNAQWYNDIGIPMPQSLTVKALGASPSFANSSVASATYDVDASTTAIPRSGLMLWLRADNGLTLSGSQVTNWFDVSGNGNSASQATSGDRPTLVTGAINGLPAVNFNGSSDFLQIPAGLSSLSSGCSIFVVTNPASVSAGARFLDFGNGAASDNVLLQEPTSTGAELSTYNGSSGTSVTSSSAITLGQFQLLEAIDGSGTATVYTNAVEGAQNGSMNTMNNLTRSQNYIGQASAGGNYFDGEIAEILFWNRAVTASEIASIEGYLLAKYQVLPSTSVAPPTISVAAGTLNGPTQVALEAPAAAQIFYTDDGSTPTTSSNLYVAPLSVFYSQTIKAIAVINGVSSSVASNAYTLDSTQWPAPSATDSTPLQLNIQLPRTAIPQDSNQH